MAEIYSTQPKLHRSGVTSVDSADPADTSGAIDTKGYKECRFDVTIDGTDFESLEVQGLLLSGGSRQKVILITSC